LNSVKIKTIDFILNITEEEFNLENFNKLDLIGKFLYYEMRISFLIFSFCKLNFDKKACLEELLYYNKDLYIFIEKNIDFFISLTKEIDEIIFNKSFKTRFKLGFNELDTIIYSCIIIKSLYSIDDL